jgi:2',3'-cyclic-nucleotide 3'-phosphodiesterase/NEDD4-binding protein 2
MKNKGTLILLRGIPGCGKTTLAKFLVESFKKWSTYEICADYFFEDLHGNYNFDLNKLGAAHSWCKQQVRDVLDFPRRDSFPVVIVHNTFTTEKEIAPYEEIAKEYGLDFISLIVENRHGNSNIHNVPEETLERMKNRFSVKI